MFSACFLIGLDNSIAEYTEESRFICADNNNEVEQIPTSFLTLRILKKISKGNIDKKSSGKKVIFLFNVLVNLFL